jgi:peptidoglycan/xylan/chitin deacetylase (PgdA/CDA1 family)
VNGWLDALRHALDTAASVRFFFRDDDAGWEDERLYRLLDLFAEHRVALDLAVIPQALSEASAENLRKRWHSGLLGLHQHGYSHTNHETEGRKYEFGPGRTRAQQRHDLITGRERLAALLGPALEPIFTPPWNRCTETTTACLAELGYRLLSREARAQPLALHGLTELPITVDWLRQHRGEAIRIGQRPVGIMLHHALMDEQDLHGVRELLALLAKYDNVQCQLMREIEG